MIIDPPPLRGYEAFADRGFYLKRRRSDCAVLRLYRRTLPSLHTIADILQAASVKAEQQPRGEVREGYVDSLEQVLSYYDLPLLRTFFDGGSAAVERIASVCSGSPDEQRAEDLPEVVAQYGTVSYPVLNRVRSSPPEVRDRVLQGVLWHPPYLMQNRGVQWVARWPQANWLSPPMNWSRFTGDFLLRSPTEVRSVPLAPRHSPKVRTVMRPVHEATRAPDLLARLYDHTAAMNKELLLVVAAAVLAKDRPDLNVLPVIGLM